MPALILNDAREYIFPLFLVKTEGDGVYLEKREFLGTAFFVTKCGDAITASHVVPKPENIDPGKRVVAIVQQGSEQTVCWVTHAATFEKCDLALVHINLNKTKYLDLTDEKMPAGTDIQLIGIPSHEVWMKGKEMRLLKGHVTMAGECLELNIAIPLGMSGSPVFYGTKVAAYATMSVSSEEVEDYTEEIELLSNNKEQIRITKVTRVTQYGVAYPFSNLKEHASPIFENKTLMQFISARNNEP